MLRLRIVLRQGPDGQVDKLLEEKRQQRPQAGNVVRGDSDVDGMQRGAKLTQVEIAFGRGGVDAGVEPQRQSGRDGLADAVDQIGTALEVVLQGLDGRLRVRLVLLPTRLDALHHGLRTVSARQQTQDFTKGQWQLGRLREETRRPREGRARAVGPELLVARDMGKHHLRDALDVLERVDGAAAYIREGVVARGAGIGCQRIEQKHFLSCQGPDARRGRPVFLLDVEADQRRFVEQAVWDDQADAFARAGRGVAGHMLRSAEPQVAMAAVLAHVQAVGLAVQTAGHALAAGGPARLAMQGFGRHAWPALASDACQQEEDRQPGRDAGRDLEPAPDDRRFEAIVVPVAPELEQRHRLRRQQAGAEQEGG